jgi:hypothetical protein
MTQAILLQINTGLNLDVFKSDSSSNPVYNYLLLGLIAAFLVFASYYYLTRRTRLREQALQREETRLRLMLSEANLGDNERTMLEHLAGSALPQHIQPLLSLRTSFEAATDRFREEHADDPLIKRIPGLRQRLGYGIGNLRNPFVSTRMLAPGLRLQCTLPSAKRQVTFLTTILGVGERAFFIKPPTTHGNPADLTRFETLTFKLARERDAQYEFDCRLMAQAQSGIRPVALEHSTSIRKLLFRNAPRVPVALDVHFFVVKQEVAAEHKHRTFKRAESQYSLLGKILDLSLGGLRLIAELPGQKPVEGDIVVFQLPTANIKDDLVAEVIDVVTPQQDTIQMHMQFIGTKEINRLKMSKFLQDEQERQGQPEAAPPPPSISSGGEAAGAS